MRVVIDANVLVAGYAARGLCKAIVEFCIAYDEIFLTGEILSDVHDKLIRKIKLPLHEADEMVVFLNEYVRIVKPSPVPLSICRDPDDTRVLGAAETADAEYIITGDKDLLVLKQYLGAMIVRPRAYWEIRKTPE